MGGFGTSCEATAKRADRLGDNNVSHYAGLRKGI